jgi:hypothetical protein
MASEPAEPTTRQDNIEIRVSPADFYLDTQALAVRFPGEKHWHLVRPSRIGTSVGLGSELEKLINADWGLLADPAQTTELAAAKRAYDTTVNEINKYAAQLTRKRYTIRDLTHENRLLTAQRDRLSLLLRGMARKLVNYRKWMSGDDVPVVHRLRREAEERQARVAELEASVGHHATMRGDAAAQREMLKTRIDAALMVCDEYPAGWNAPTLAHDRLRAALVGDQPPAEATLECPHCRSLIRAASGAVTQLDVDTHLAVCGPARQFARECATSALSGVALRDVEEAGDAAGDLP